MKNAQLTDFLETTEGNLWSQREGSNLRPADYESTGIAFQIADNKNNYAGHKNDCAQIVLTCDAASNRSVALQPGQPPPGRSIPLGKAEKRIQRTELLKANSARVIEFVPAR
jgi:hypothetical protein